MADLLEPSSYISFDIISLPPPIFIGPLYQVNVCTANGKWKILLSQL